MRHAPGPYVPFRHRLHAFAREVKGVAAGDVEAVHHARVATRRLRELLPVLGLNSSAEHKLDRRLRKITKQLGVVRQLDVLMATIEELSGKRRYSPAALARLRASVGRARAAAHDRLAAKLPLTRLQRLVQRLDRAADRIAPGGEHDGQQGALRQSRKRMRALDARVVRRAAQARSAIRRAGAVYAPQRLHAVRIAVKKLRYARELQIEAHAKGAARDVAVLKATQDLLGRLHDLEVLVQWARDEAVDGRKSTADGQQRELDALTQALERDCRALHARYMRRRTPLAALATRLEARAVSR